jgi:hypothetical protein
MSEALTTDIIDTLETILPYMAESVRIQRKS